MKLCDRSLRPSKRRLTGLAGLALAACTGGSGRAHTEPVTTPRIASQTLLSDDVLWDLGPDSRAKVVGVSALADDARYASHPHRWPDGIPRISTTGEAVLALAPTLAVIASFTAAETTQLLSASGIPTLTLEGFEGFDAYRRHVHEIGSAVGDAQGAAKLIEDFDQRLESRPTNPRPRPTIVSYNGGMVPGLGTTFDDEAEAAGFINVATRHGLKGHSQVAIEQVAAWDPAFIVVPCGRDCTVAAESLAKQPGLGATRAVQDGRVIAIRSALLFSTGADMLDVVDQLAAAREHR